MHLLETHWVSQEEEFKIIDFLHCVTPFVMGIIRIGTASAPPHMGPCFGMVMPAISGVTLHGTTFDEDGSLTEHNFLLLHRWC
jgi:hypothetical protein